MLCDDLLLAHKLGPEASNRIWPQRVNQISPPARPKHVDDLIWGPTSAGNEEFSRRLAEAIKNDDAAMAAALNCEASAKDMHDAASALIPLRLLLRDRYQKVYDLVVSALQGNETSKQASSGKRRGRRTVTQNTPEEDRIQQAWDSNSHKTFDDCDRALGLHEGTTKATIDRLRKRRSRPS